MKHISFSGIIQCKQLFYFILFSDIVMYVPNDTKNLQ